MKYVPTSIVAASFAVAALALISEYSLPFLYWLTKFALAIHICSYVSCSDGDLKNTLGFIVAIFVLFYLIVMTLVDLMRRH
jgi:hypothetical protein